MKKLKLTIKIKNHISSDIETKVLLIAISDDENIEDFISMAYGSWYDIIEYSSEDIDIFVSDMFCKKVVASLLLKTTIL